MNQPDIDADMTEQQVQDGVIQRLAMEIAQLKVSNAELDTRYQGAVAARVRAEARAAAAAKKSDPTAAPDPGPAPGPADT